MSAKRCAKCGCKLNSYNLTDTCSPCSVGEVELPRTLVALADQDIDPTTVSRLARMVSGQKYDPAGYANRNRAIRVAYATGQWTQYDLARKWGISRTTVEYILAKDVA